MEQKDSKNIILSVLGVAILLIAVVGVSYAIFLFTFNSNRDNYISTGSISMTYNEGITNTMSITNAIPISDEVGTHQLEYFDFKVSSKISGKAKVKYNITVEKLANSNSDLELNSSNIKLYLEKEENSKFKKCVDPVKYNLLNKYNNSTDERVLYTGSFSNDSVETKEEVQYFKLRMWIADSFEMTDIEKSFKMRVNVHAKM